MHKLRSDSEADARHLEREALARDIRGSKVDPLLRDALPGNDTGSRIVAGKTDAHLDELKRRAAAAAYQHIRSNLKVPVHNARCAQAVVDQHDTVMGRSIVKAARFNIRFDIPYSSPGGSGVRTASIPVTFGDSEMLVGTTISYNGKRQAATQSALNAISALPVAPSKTAGHVILAALTDKGHRILGATDQAPAITAVLRSQGFRVAFRDPSEALEINVKEPFYEVLAGANSVNDIRRVVAHLLVESNAPSVRKAQESEHHYNHPHISSLAPHKFVKLLKEWAAAFKGNPDAVTPEAVERLFKSRGEERLVRSPARLDAAVEYLRSEIKKPLQPTSTDYWMPNDAQHAYSKASDDRMAVIGARSATKTPQEAKGAENPTVRVGKSDPRATRKAQSDPLQIPASTTPVAASPQLESVLKDIGQLSTVKAELDAEITKVTKALYGKFGFENSEDVAKRASALEAAKKAALEDIGAPLIQLADGGLLAKWSTVRLNDPAWNTYLQKIGTRAKRLVAYLTRWVELFRTVTVSSKWKEIEPKDISKTFKHNVGEGEKLKNFTETQKDLSAKAPKYLLDDANGGIERKSGRSAQAAPPPEGEDIPDMPETKKDEPFELTLLETAVQDMADRGESEAQIVKDLNFHLNNSQKVEEANEQFPLPQAPVTAARKVDAAKHCKKCDEKMKDGKCKKCDSKKAARGTGVRAPTLMAPPFTPGQMETLDNMVFSSAGQGKHGLFYRAASKTKSQTGREIRAALEQDGFSSEEAYTEIARRQAQAHVIPDEDPPFTDMHEVEEAAHEKEDDAPESFRVKHGADYLGMDGTSLTPDPQDAKEFFDKNEAISAADQVGPGTRVVMGETETTVYISSSQASKAPAGEPDMLEDRGVQGTEVPPERI
jgi:hypothetical protein